jgi:hypothetical protein
MGQVGWNDIQHVLQAAVCTYPYFLKKKGASHRKGFWSTCWMSFQPTRPMSHHHCCCLCLAWKTVNSQSILIWFFLETTQTIPVSFSLPLRIATMLGSALFFRK